MYYCFSQYFNSFYSNKIPPLSHTKHIGEFMRKPSKTKWKPSKQWLKTYVPVFCSMAALLIFSIITICVMPAIETSVIEGSKRTYASGLPLKTVAPFVDMSSWIDPNSAYSINGVPNLGKFAEDTSVKVYNLGFINPLTNNPTNADGSINWGWGGYSSLTKNSTNSQYLGIKQSIQNLKDMGGTYIVSVGGQAGDAPWKVTQNVDSLEAMYLDIIDTYSIKRLDLDIEENNQDTDHNIANAKAIKRVQDATNIEITLTIPIMPSGWQQKQINIIDAYLSQGVDVTMINSMCMCYGSGVAVSEDYGDASIRAIENSIQQMKVIYSNYGQELTDVQAYQKTGCTVSIGYESYLYPTFTPSMMQKVAAHAKKHNYGMLSFWSMGRDSTIDGNTGISSKYAFTEIAVEYLV